MCTYFTQAQLLGPLVLLVNIGALNGLYVAILYLFLCMFHELQTGTRQYLANSTTRSACCCYPIFTTYESVHEVV